MRYITQDFTVSTALTDENIPENMSIRDAVMVLAKEKAKPVYDKNEDSLVIGADTLVVLHGKPYGKPLDEDDARRMLHELSGKKHMVYTGVAIYCQGQARTFVCETEVELAEMSDAEIDRYIASGEPFNKSGAYAIQEGGCLFVKKIQGDFYNVMGLPVSTLYQTLKEMGILREN